MYDVQPIETGSNQVALFGVRDLISDLRRWLDLLEVNRVDEVRRELIETARAIDNQIPRQKFPCPTTLF